jgi:hypothetical protein
MWKYNWKRMKAIGDIDNEATGLRKIILYTPLQSEHRQPMPPSS